MIVLAPHKPCSMCNLAFAGFVLQGLVRTIVVASLGCAVPTPTVIVVVGAAPITLAAPVAVVITRVWEVNIYSLITTTFVDQDLWPIQKKEGEDNLAILLLSQFSSAVPAFTDSGTTAGIEP